MEFKAAEIKKLLPNNLQRKKSVLSTNSLTTGVIGGITINQMMELDMPPQDKLYYHFIQGGKDAKKLYQAASEMFTMQSNKNSKESFEILVSLSKKLTDNAYFAEAKLFN